MTATTEQVTHGQVPLADDFVLHEQDLSEQAKQQFGYHAEFLRVLELHRRCVLSNDYLTHEGRYILLNELSELHRTCKNTLNYAAANRETSSHSPIGNPLIICGLPRTGSTVLYNLLACDPKCRATLVTDMLGDCMPPISRSNSAEHRQRALRLRQKAERNKELIGRPNLFAASHPLLPTEEDYLILRHTGFLPFFMMNAPDPLSELTLWFDNETNKDCVYDYHQTFLRMLNSVDAPQSHWLLKSPFHTLHLDSLLKHYPQASLVMTHRRLTDVIPSWCRLYMECCVIYCGEADREARTIIVRVALQIIGTMIQRIVKYRTPLDHLQHQLTKPVFDVAYDDLLDQPITTVRRIYDHFGLNYSDEFEKNMQIWLDRNPQGKQGRNAYNLTDIELTQEDIETRYSDYIDLFHPYLSPKSTAINELIPSTDTSAATV